jgi:predicted ATP-binding protein involved in virulence
MVAWSELVVNFPHYRRIDKIFENAKNYIQQSQSINEPITQYLRIVNGFLKDSDKEIVFDGKGNLLVRVSKHEPVPITSLSSGESQIVIMITHLSFNPESKRANVFIVDEPELSLHVAWQELFVDAITKANPNLQVILATHAPSIILDRLDNCIDLAE